MRLFENNKMDPAILLYFCAQEVGQQKQWIRLQTVLLQVGKDFVVPKLRHEKHKIEQWMF